MPLFFQKNINEHTKLAIWKIEEQEDFFNGTVSVQREISHPQKRLQHLAGRYLLSFLFPDFPYKDIEIAKTRKPYLVNEQYHFSISHCNNFAAAIVSSTHRVGVDIEYITPRLFNIKNKYLHQEELRFINTFLESRQLNLLSVFWSAKEAIYKWYGIGEVDFKNMMRIFPLSLADEGEINAAFMKGQFQKQLLLFYKFVEELTLVWVTSEM